MIHAAREAETLQAYAIAVSGFNRDIKGGASSIEEPTGTSLQDGEWAVGPSRSLVPSLAHKPHSNGFFFFIGAFLLEGDDKKSCYQTE